MIFNIDFDGTCTTHDFPQTGKNIGAEIVLKQLIKRNHQLILFTMRCDHDFDPVSEHADIIAEKGNYLTQAVNWFKEHNIPLYGIQKNPTQHTWTSSHKSYAHYMIDDSAIGTPLLNIPQLSNKPFVNWIEIAYLLCRSKLITEEQEFYCHVEIKNYFLKNYKINI